MKSITYKNRLINQLNNYYPIEQDFIVKVKRFEFTDKRNMQETQFGRMQWTVAEYQDAKQSDSMWSIITNHPNIHEAIGDLIIKAMIKNEKQ